MLKSSSPITAAQHAQHVKPVEDQYSLTTANICSKWQELHEAHSRLIHAVHAYWQHAFASVQSFVHLLLSMKCLCLCSYWIYPTLALREKEILATAGLDALVRCRMQYLVSSDVTRLLICHKPALYPALQYMAYVLCYHDCFNAEQAQDLVIYNIALAKPKLCHALRTVSCRDDCRAIYAINAFQKLCNIIRCYVLLTADV